CGGREGVLKKLRAVENELHYNKSLLEEVKDELQKMRQL
nr:Chain A, RETRO-GCN4 LEUCINE ZIPPER [synthetic construct]1C94_B Chain B, RETRO-GCN4 LEUCINE ZIPPER [synthetic construct]